MNNKEFKNKNKKRENLNKYDLLEDKYNLNEFSEPFMQGGLRTKKLVEIGENILKNNYNNEKDN